MQKRGLVIFIYPLCLALMALVLAQLFFLRRRLRPWGILLSALALAALVAGSSAHLGELALSSIEDQAYKGEKSAGVAEIIAVLGGGNYAREDSSPVARLRPSSLYRLIEGIRLQRLNPGSRLLLSGGFTQGAVSEAAAMAEVAMALGVARDSILLEEKSMNTEDQARLIAPLVKGKKALLVTSAWHAPRALWLIRQEGAEVQLAPADRLTGEPTRSFLGILPQSRNIQKTEIALYERVAAAWLWLKSRWGR